MRNQGVVHTLRFICMRCDGCCRFSGSAEYPVLLPHEALHIRILAERMGVGTNLEQLEGGFVRWLVGDVCPFYEPATRSCLIHEEKPFSCRMFPLVADVTGMRLLVSLHCSWVRTRFGEIQGLDPREVFPDEFKALEELLRILFSGFEEALFLALPEEAWERINAPLEEAGCIVLSKKSSRAIKGLVLSLIAGCSDEAVGEVLELVGEKPILAERVAIPRARFSVS